MPSFILLTNPTPPESQTDFVKPPPNLVTTLKKICLTTVVPIVASIVVSISDSLFLFSCYTFLFAEVNIFLVRLRNYSTTF